MRRGHLVWLQNRYILGIQEQMDTLRQAQLNYLAQPQPTPSVAAVQTPMNNQTNLTPSPQRSFNGWMVGCIASLSLLLGGGTVFAFNHINQSSQADSVATTASIKEEAQEQAQEQARKEYEQQLEELLNRTNLSTTESSMENSKESDPSKAKEGSSDSTVQSNTSESSESNEVK